MKKIVSSLWNDEELVDITDVKLRLGCLFIEANCFDTAGSHPSCEKDSSIHYSACAVG